MLDENRPALYEAAGKKSQEMEIKKTCTPLETYFRNKKLRGTVTDDRMSVTRE